MNRSPQCPKCLQSLEDSANFCPACGEDLRGLSPTADTMSGPWTGKVIDGRYRLMEKLGEGGMGTVYKVEHVRMGKILALKVLRPDLAIDKKLKARFHQEARVVSKLSHPNTIQVFDFGELDDGSLYIAMEFLAGRDLMWRLRTHGPFNEERAIAIGIQALSSLAEAHELDIIHRDIKPANIMLLRRKDGTDTVKVLDFGIAKLNEGESRKHITGVADFLGTPMYMSPEQGAGEALDARSDLYSVAAMLFELVTGRGVFEGPTAMSIVTQHMSAPPPKFAQVAPDRLISPAFEAVIRKALSKKREDRYASADQMREALERVRREVVSSFADFTPVADLNTGKVASRQDFDRFERSLRARRVLFPLFTLALIGAAGFGAWWTLLRPEAGAVFTAEREPNDEPQRATPIPLNQVVQGMIGRPSADNDSDHDVFVVELPEDSVLTVELGGVPDMNLVLDAYQFTSSASGAEASAAALKLQSPGSTGKSDEKLERILLVDDGRTGEGERVDGLRVRQGPLFLRIQEKAHRTESPRPARETTQSAYSLNIRPMEQDLERVEHESADDRIETAPASPLSRAIRA
ncbi:MAG: serine/threonine-protein kinase, partial [Myxococcaceae bacterium]